MVFHTLPFLLEAPIQSPNAIARFAPLIFIAIIFYFLLIRPQQKQRKMQQKLVESLATGDKVITSSGMHGMIANVKDRTILLKVCDNVKIEIEKNSVATVVERSSEPVS